LSDGRCKIDGLAMAVGSCGPKVKAMNITRTLMGIECILNGGGEGPVLWAKYGSRSRKRVHVHGLVTGHGMIMVMVSSSEFEIICN